MATSPNPMSLPPGVLSYSVNLRYRNGCISCRGGMTASLGTIQASSSFRGIWSGPNNVSGGGDAILVALLVSGAVRIYRSTDASTWTELTTASGQYGDTRMSDAPVTFEVVPYHANGAMNYIVANNGADYPRVMTPTGGIYIHEPIDIPLYAATIPVKYEMDRWLTVADASTTTPSDSGGGLTCADSTLPGGTSGADNVARFSVDSGTIANNHSAQVLFSGAMGSSQTGRNDQLIVGIDTPIQDFWSYFALQLHFVSTGSWVTFFDPTDSEKYPQPTPVPIDNSQRLLWTLDLQTILGPNAGIADNELDGFRFVYKDPATGAAALSGSPTFDVFCCALAGSYSGGDRFAAALGGGHFLESPGVIYASQQTQQIKDIGGPVVGYGSANLPLSPLLRFVVKTPRRDVDTTDLNRGVQFWNVYRQSEGIGPFYELDIIGTASYMGGAWKYDSTGTTSPSDDVIYETLATSQASVAGIRQMPGAYHLPIPIGRGMKWTNGRLFVGSTDAAIAGVGVSGRKDPFRFVRLLQLENGALDEDGPAVIDLMGETAVAFSAVSSSLIGASQVFSFTRNGVYSCSGTNASQLIAMSRISRFGTVSPWSIAELNGQIFYLDTEMQVRVLAGGQVQNISRNLVDDSIAEIPASRRPYVMAEVNREYYYLAFSPEGAGTNAKILVWDDVVKSWTFDEPPIPCEGFTSFFDGATNARRLIAVGDDGNGYEYDVTTQDQDLGTDDISCRMTFWEIHAPDGKNLSIGRVGVTADDVPGATGTVTRTYKPNGALATSSIDLAAAGDQIVRYDGTQTGGSKGVAALLDLQLDLTAGKRIYKVVAEIEPRDHAYDVT